MGITSERLKSILRNTLEVFLASFVVIFVGVLVYGIVSYPDGPIRECGADQFCGKWNRLHTEQEFKDFITWENVLLYSFASAVVAGGVLASRRRRRASQDLEYLLAKQRDLSPAVEEQRYAAAWRGRRRRKIAASVLSILALSSVSWAASAGLPNGLLQIALVALTVGSIFWFHLFRCPRCGHQFLTRQSRDRCHFCGLRRGATFEESLAESKDATELRTLR